MDFRSRLLRTLHAVRPVLDVSGVMVIGSEVPNLLEQDAASTLVVSQDVDIAVPIICHDSVKQKLAEITDLSPSKEEPSVWIPQDPTLIEVNFVGMDTNLHDPNEAYVFEDSQLPLLVFGTLSWMRPRKPIDVDGLSIPVPRIAGLMLEKLVTDRTGEKGNRDLLVVLGLLLVASQEDKTEFLHAYHQLAKELQYVIRSNLTILSLLDASEGMPNPRPHREYICEFLRILERESKNE